jgi:beta-N-acetylhexosaminidase
MAVDMSQRMIRRQIGQLVVAGFDGMSVAGELRRLASEFDLGGLILFARNVESPEQVAEIAREAQSLRRELPLWVSLDQEGGRVARLREPFTRWPPMIALGRSGDSELAERFAGALAAELSAVGITLDYAPVLDILTTADNPAIGDRALADNAEDVARLGAVIIEALQASGVAACGKHFPGHGDTTVDSHAEMPIVEHDLERLRAVELQPFRSAIAANVAAIMTGHLLVPSLDEEAPATMSRAIVHDLLRGELGFDGVIFTDDLDMGALATRYDIGQIAVGAVAAGCDGLLLCGPDHDKQHRALEALVHAAEDGTLSVAAVERSMARHRRMKERFLADVSRGRRQQPELSTVLGCAPHRAIAEEMAQFL